MDAPLTAALITMEQYNERLAAMLSSNPAPTLLGKRTDPASPATPSRFAPYNLQAPEALALHHRLSTATDNLERASFDYRDSDGNHATIEGRLIHLMVFLGEGAKGFASCPKYNRNKKLLQKKGTYSIFLDPILHIFTHSFF